MKSPYFTEEHTLFRQSVRQFVEKEILPYADQWEKDEKIDRALFRKLGEQGFLGINHEEAYGGSQVDIFYTVAYLEELARCGYAGVCAAVSVHQYMATNHLAHAGSHALKEKFLKPAIEGKMVGAIAISEPGAGSDVANLRTTAVREGDHYIINGSKTFITNGHFGDFVVVACKTDAKAGVNGVSLIVVERGTPGFSSTQLKKIGWHSSDTGELAFDQVKVSAENLVGQENMGFFYIMESFQLERLVAGILGIGGGEKCTEVTLKYLNEREVFGKQIKKYQVLRHDLVDLLTEAEAAKQLVYHTCWQYENGDMPVKECSMVKLYCTELSNRFVDKCLQMFGGYGYMEEYPIARMYRDARVGTIVGGTSQIMREIIAKIVIDDVRYKKVYQSDAVEKPTDEADWGNPTTAQDILRSLPKRIKSEKAAGFSTIFHFNLSGETGGQFTVFVKDGKCTVEDGLLETADCVVTAKASTYEEVELGKLAPEMAVMSGQLQISNLGAMMGFAKLFKRVVG
ncbi:MAG: acyl-CoA dehydrogenase family protein [Chitinophagales bacterium]|nr:acyl-CoA dehydrogenase family protein [Chitinophagales bacterium]